MPTRELRKVGQEINLAEGLDNHSLWDGLPLHIDIQHRFTRLPSIQVLALASWSIYYPPVTRLCCLLA